MSRTTDVTEPTDKIRSAGVRKEERLAAGMDTAGIVQAARSSINELDTTRRVYEKQWMIAGRFDEELEAQEYLDRTFGGRLVPEDMEVVRTRDGAHGVVAKVRRWNIHSEWKREDLAEAAVQELLTKGAGGADLTVVLRNSRAEHDLANYGKLLLKKR